MSTRAGDATPYLPQSGVSLEELGEAADGCRGCPLWEGATQAVFGEGPPTARLVLVGEQPGDSEDIEGRPFVGPAGRELDRALEKAGIDRSLAYVTNAVKHFKFRQRGKRRIHDKPSTATLHLSAVLRAREEEERERMRATMTSDLRLVADELKRLS